MQFHVVSFEGPDPYSRAGGLASRIDGMTRALASLGFETHLWFVGDPEAPGHETREGVQLHRWCQWLSRGHPAGVYAGEEEKRADLTVSLPPFLMDHHLGPALRRGERAVVLAEEWHTANAVVEIDRRLRAEALRDRVTLLWNANNVFGFDRIGWRELTSACVVTTVSRIMRHRIEPRGVRPLVLANGLPDEAYALPDRATREQLRRAGDGRALLVKVARWDPDKNWLAALRGVAELRAAGRRPLLVARGGAESYGAEVRRVARDAGLRWRDLDLARDGLPRLAAAIRQADETDVLGLRSPLDGASSRGLFRVADAVLANSGFEPFGLVGLETMAVGGVACTGMSGEDYAIPGRNALVMQTDDPSELCAVLARLRAHPEEEGALRRAARATARQYAWTEIVKRVLLPRLEMLRAPGSPGTPAS